MRSSRAVLGHSLPCNRGSKAPAILFLFAPLVRLSKSIRFATLAVLLGAAAEGRVERVEILSRSDLLPGKSFGLAGPYEKIAARVHFKVRPDNPHNKQIADL